MFQGEVRTWRNLKGMHAIRFQDRDEAKAKGLIPPGTTDFDGVDRYGENDPFIFNGYRQEEYDAFYARYPFLYQKGDWTHFEAEDMVAVGA